MLRRGSFTCINYRKNIAKIQIMISFSRYDSSKHCVRHGYLYVLQRNYVLSDVGFKPCLRWNISLQSAERCKQLYALGSVRCVDLLITAGYIDDFCCEATNCNACFPHRTKRDSLKGGTITQDKTRPTLNIQAVIIYYALC